MVDEEYILDLYKAGQNLQPCFRDLVAKFLCDETIPKTIVEEVMDETIKYLSFIQRRLDEISVKTDVDKGKQEL